MRVATKVAAKCRRRRKLKRARDPGEAGFTLIELMVSMFVFSIGMSGVIAMHIGIMQNNSMANDISLASNIAMSGLERLKISDFALVVASSTCPPADPTFDMACYFDKRGQLVVTAEDAYFTRTWVAVFDPVMGVTDVTVTVNWRFSMSGGNTRAAHDIKMIGRLYPR